MAAAKALFGFEAGLAAAGLLKDALVWRRGTAGVAAAAGSRADDTLTNDRRDGRRGADGRAALVAHIWGEHFDHTGSLRKYRAFVAVLHGS